MFWKNVYHQWCKHDSMLRRLTLWYLFSTSGLLAILLLFLHSIMHQILDQASSSIYCYEIAVVFILGSAAAGIIGYLIARRGMRHLAELTSTAKNITINDLHQRIVPEIWPQELRALGVSFNQMLNRIEADFTRVRHFSADLAHELRTPLHNLMGQTEMALLNGSALQHEQLLTSNLEELHRLKHIIDDLSFLSQAENPYLQITKESFAVHTVLASACDFYQPLADEKNIAMTVTGDGMVTAHRTMFIRVIHNLLANAIDAVSNSGLIQCHVNIMQDKTAVIIKDNGHGIAPEVLPYIFDRFYRGVSKSAKAIGGSGLGLAIVKSIIELHQGQITIQSEVGKGSVITMLW